MLGGEGTNFPTVKVTENILSECGIFSDFDFNNDREKKAQEIVESYAFSQEEEEYIKLTGLTSRPSDIKKNVNIATFQIIISNKLRELFDENTLLEMKKYMNESEMFNDSRYYKTKKIYNQILSNGIVDENIHELLENQKEKIINESVEHYFNDLINCGGYSFKIDTCIYPRSDLSFSQNVSGLLDKFPFARLLGNTQLEDDEYLVIYRAPKEKAKGHHFIRVDSDGVVREKDGNGQPQIFEDWGARLSDLEDNEEAIFAVKKGHKMFGYDRIEVNNPSMNELDFAQAVDKAIKSKTNIFIYHSQTFLLKKDESNIYVGLSGGDIVASVDSENGEYKTIVYPDKIKSVENLTGNITPIIKDGKLQNFDEFVGRNNPDLNDEAR